MRNVVLIGDSGGNQKGMKAVAADLSKKWASSETRVHFIPEYYGHESADKWLAGRASRTSTRGARNSIAVSATQAPEERPAAWGKKIIGFRPEATAKATRKAAEQFRPVAERDG
ncbi:hypothetical protein [Frigoriglobus tundricola]|uniref:hypothetical protein n=1 Tax=Frigoriglobus tundricola TaxID=2774151 RepID=UPI00148ECE86|nr:hypothetical protein [Frigoriglobus tundricola]